MNVNIKKIFSEDMRSIFLLAQKVFFAIKARRHEGARRGDCHGARDFSVDDEYFLCASQ
jgi:hypothetical protein